MKTETIEEKTYRLLQIANKNDEGVAIDSDFEGEMFNSLLDNTIFKLHCKMIELAIAEEREACVQKVALWALTKDMSSNLRLGLASAIRGRATAPKDEVTK